jgi:glutathione reductase (NADPH)
MPQSAGGERWISSDEAFHLSELPKRIAVLGAGYIGVEFAHIFAGFGSDVTLVHRHPHVLSGFADFEAAAQVERGLAARGIKLVIADRVEGAFDVCMAATGREPMSNNLGLVEAGVVIDGRGAIVVDEWSRTSVPHIYAVGDVTQRMQLTPVAIREGHAVADTVFGKRVTSINHELIPTAVFAQPPLAQIGMTEAAALAAGHDVQVFRSRFKPMRYALSGRDEQVFIKVVVARAADQGRGGHVGGPHAPGIVQSVAVAVAVGAAQGAVDRTYAQHPTTAEERVLLR